MKLSFSVLHLIETSFPLSNKRIQTGLATCRQPGFFPPAKGRAIKSLNIVISSGLLLHYMTEQSACSGALFISGKGLSATCWTLKDLVSESEHKVSKVICAELVIFHFLLLNVN